MTQQKSCWTLYAVSVALVLFGGLMSGLTLGLMSLDSVQLEVLKRTGSPEEKERAARIMPVRCQACSDSASALHPCVTSVPDTHSSAVGHDS